LTLDTGLENKSKQNKSSPVEILVNENFVSTLKLKNGLQFDALLANASDNGFLLSELKLNRSVCNMSLSANGKKLLMVPNAGGNSVNSEVMSYEFLKSCFDAELIKTEMEVEYFPEGGSITDYVCQIFNRKIGVSVTRAMKYHGNYTKEDAERLLTKKLNGVIQSTRNSLESWHKQILHVWAASKSIASTLIETYKLLDNDTKSNTVIVITIATSADDIFLNK